MLHSIIRVLIWETPVNQKPLLILKAYFLIIVIMSKYILDSNIVSSSFQSQDDMFSESTPREADLYTNIGFNANSNIGMHSGINKQYQHS